MEDEVMYVLRIRLMCSNKTRDDDYVTDYVLTNRLHFGVFNLQYLRIFLSHYGTIHILQHAKKN